MSDGLSNSVNKLKFCICELSEEIDSLNTTLNDIESQGQEFLIKHYTTEGLPFDNFLSKNLIFNFNFNLTNKTNRSILEKNIESLIEQGLLAFDTTLKVHVYYKNSVWYRVSNDTEVNIGPTATLNLPYDIADGAIAYDTTIGGFVYFDLASLSWYTNDNDNILIASKVSWTPEFIVGDKLSGWYDATEETTLTSGSTGVTGSISEWIEKRRGGIKDFVNDNGITGSQPITGSTSVINSKNTILFDGVNDYMQTRYGLLAENGETISNWYMYILYKVPNLPTSAAYLFKQITNSGFYSHAPWTDNRIYFDNPNPGYRVYTSSFFQANTPYLVEYSSSITDNKMELLIDAGETDGVTGDVNPSTIAGFMNIGSANGIVNPTNASIGEMVYVNGYLQQSEKQQIEGYLANKWGTTASLPVDHPYKNVSPTAIYTNKLINEPLSSGLSDRVLPSIVSFTGSASTTASREYDSSKSEWAQPYTDAVIMDGKLSSINSTTGLNWDLRVGKGGQIYSLRTDTLNETIPPQFRDGSPPDSYFSPWNDDCWILTAVDTTKTIWSTNNFTHSCGVYLEDPILKHPFSSPRFATEINPADRSYTIMNWNQPSGREYQQDRRSDVFNIIKYKDLGEGVIEMTSGQYNYGVADMPWLNMPWGGFRVTSLPHGFRRFDGDYIGITGLWGGKAIPTVFNIATETDGWAVYSQTTSGNDESMAFVFGQDRRYEEASNRPHIFRAGYAGGTNTIPPGSTETNWRNYFVTTLVRRHTLRQGHGVWSRCYFVFGSDFADIEDKIQSRNLVTDATIELMDYTEENTDLISYGFTGTNESFVIRPTTRESDIDFYLYKSPVTKSFPIYLLTKSDGTPPYLSWDPYTIGTYKMYDGTLSDIQLLGFALRTTDTSPLYNYESLDIIMASTTNYNRGLSGESLSVRV